MATGSTPLYGIPYPLQTDQVNVHTDMQQMATAIESVFGVFNVSLTFPNTWTASNVFQTSTTTPTVKITQAGSGHALLVEDSASDTTPFIIDSSGNVVIGKNTAATAKLDVVGNIALTGSLVFPGGITISAPAASGSIPVNPMTTQGDIIVGGTSGSQVRLAGATTANNVLVYDTATNAPKWTNSVDDLSLFLPNIHLDNVHSSNDGHITWDSTSRELKVGNGTGSTVFQSFVVNQTPITSNYTFTGTDRYRLNQMNGAFKFIVPLDATVNYSVGTQIHMIALTAGVSVEFTSGITSYFTPGLKLRGAGSMATLIKLGANTWALSGDLTA